MQTYVYTEPLYGHIYINVQVILLEQLSCSRITSCKNRSYNYETNQRVGNRLVISSIRPGISLRADDQQSISGDFGPMFIIP